jgi:xylulokinase
LVNGTEYVIGVDLGTSAVKVLLVNRDGEVCAEASRSYPLHTPQSGYSEQEPDDWVGQTVAALRELALTAKVEPTQVAGISFSGQMHGLVLLDRERKPLRRAILWNDTRTTEQCREIKRTAGEALLRIARNPALEGFTLPKLLWVRQHEPHLYERAALFLLPKDYLRLRLTGQTHMDYSDAAGTLLLDVANKRWSAELCRAFAIEPELCPPLVESHACVGTLLPEVAAATGLSAATRVFAGGADNACGAIGAGILSPGATLCSIGTSGVVLTYEEDRGRDYGGKVHFFNHGQQDAFYSMGVTLAAGFSLSWFKDTFAADTSFEALLDEAGQVPVGANGLLFTPYLVGERTPHADSQIRASFIGADATHRRAHFIRAVLEGITFSLRESVDIFRAAGKTVDTVLSIGGGAKSDVWLQMQADIFRARVVKPKSEQGPGLGAAMLAALGCGWYVSLSDCAAQFVGTAGHFTPDEKNADQYDQLFPMYTQVYEQTKSLCERLKTFRDSL